MFFFAWIQDVFINAFAVILYKYMILSWFYILMKKTNIKETHNKKNWNRTFLGLPLLSVKGVSVWSFVFQKWILHFVRRIALWKCLLLCRDNEGKVESISFLHLIFKISGKSGYLQSFRFISIRKQSGDTLLARKHRNRQNISRVNKDYISALKHTP